MMSKFPEFDDFINDKVYYYEWTEPVSIDAGELPLSQEFAKTFPTMHQLVSKARVLDITSNGKKYKLLSWPDGKNSCGWLCQFEAEDAYEDDVNFLPEHELLVKNIGGIVQVYNKADSYMNNVGFFFLKSLCEPGLGYNNDGYESTCYDRGIEPTPLDNFTVFAQDGDGSPFVYDIKTKEVFYCSVSPGPDYIFFVPGQPIPTFFYIQGVVYFKDFVEMLASQWLDHIPAFMPNQPST